MILGLMKYLGRGVMILCLNKFPEYTSPPSFTHQRPSELGVV